jgi:gliding motility-associated lipoprotein GldH
MINSLINKILTAGILATVLLLTACREDIVYSRFVSVSDAETPVSPKGWHMDSAVHIQYSIPDANASYQVLVYVRHTEHYPYQNMWLFIGDSVRQDTIEFYLADDRGQWLGDKHHGFIEMPVLFEESKQYADTTVQHLFIRHGMRDSVLRGVTEVGVEIIRNGEE